MVRYSTLQHDIIRSRGQVSLQSVALLEKHIRITLALLASTFEHLQREINPCCLCCTHLCKGSCVESTTTADIGHLFTFYLNNAAHRLFPGAIHLERDDAQHC